MITLVFCCQNFFAKLRCCPTQMPLIVTGPLDAEQKAASRLRTRNEQIITIENKVFIASIDDKYYCKSKSWLQADAEVCSKNRLDESPTHKNFLEEDLKSPFNILVPPKNFYCFLDLLHILSIYRIPLISPPPPLSEFRPCTTLLPSFRGLHFYKICAVGALLTSETVWARCIRSNSPRSKFPLYVDLHIFYQDSDGLK